MGVSQVDTGVHMVGEHGVGKDSQTLERVVGLANLAAGMDRDNYAQERMIHTLDLGEEEAHVVHRVHPEDIPAVVDIGNPVVVLQNKDSWMASVADIVREGKVRLYMEHGHTALKKVGDHGRVEDTC